MSKLMQRADFVYADTNLGRLKIALITIRLELPKMGETF